ncbi:MAG TPA: hypothetical protein VM406_15770 [Noviherbaspirillum sp.]|nr:hypothetical protein [Noviherbaspirillum sp.]
MRLSILGFFLLSYMLAVPALADSGVRDAVRMSHLQNSAPGQMERRGAREFRIPEVSGNGQLADDAVAEGVRRSGKLSLEERRALRRQIDEAGHDIYSSNR